MSHYWGDDWPYWDNLNKAMDFIYTYVYRRSLCRIIMKEKYGTIRYEYFIVPGATMYKPFYIKFPFKRYCKFLDKKVNIVWHWQFSRPCNLWRRYGIFMLKRAVEKACEKFPQCKDEITEDLECFMY